MYNFISLIRPYVKKSVALPLTVMSLSPTAPSFPIFFKLLSGTVHWPQKFVHITGYLQQLPVSRLGLGGISREFHTRS